MSPAHLLRDFFHFLLLSQCAQLFVRRLSSTEGRASTVFRISKRSRGIIGLSNP